MIASVTTRAIRMETRCAWMAGSEKIVTSVCIDLDKPRDEMGQQTRFWYNYFRTCVKASLNVHADVSSGARGLSL